MDGSNREIKLDFRSNLDKENKNYYSVQAALVICNW